MPRLRRALAGRLGTSGEAWHASRQESTISRRYLLAANMLGYGAAKVFSSQFGDLVPEHLEMTLGSFSPQVLLWTFMAYSDTYEIFTGIVELLAGVLLLPRVTAFVGSVVALGATTQVLMLNLCFDVPVKLLATHLFVGSVWLVARDGRRWFPALFLGRGLAPLPPELPISERMRRIALACKVVFLVTLVVGYARFFIAEHTPEDAERAAQREAAAVFPLMRHRVRIVDDRTSMWN